MDDNDPHADEMLEKSAFIVKALENNIHHYSDSQVAQLLLMQQSMEFYLKEDNIDKAIIECRNLYNYISEITQ